MQHLFVDQYPSDEIVPGLVVKVICEKFSNLKGNEKAHTLPQPVTELGSIGIKTDLWRADTDVAVQEVMPDFKLITPTVENILRNRNRGVHHKLVKKHQASTFRYLVSSSQPQTFRGIIQYYN